MTYPTLHKKLEGLRKKKPIKGSLLYPNNVRKFDVNSLLNTLNEIEDEEKEKKESSSMDTS
tara:strand:- start:7363 stop:7545 length:183 start_codon:yes stop_codon:yes gene_type:complete